MVRSVRASLDYYTAQFGPYPYRHLSLVEHPGHGTGMHADASMLTYTEGFSLWNPKDDPRSLDLPFAVVAHEMAHQWDASRTRIRRGSAGADREPRLVLRDAGRGERHADASSFGGS